MTNSDLAYILIFVAMGIALDWAFFWRTHNLMGAFRPIKDGDDYKELLFPRVILTVLGSAIVVWGALEAPPSVSLIVVGSTLFMLSVLYANYQLWRHGRSK